MSADYGIIVTRMIRSSYYGLYGHSAIDRHSLGAHYCVLKRIQMQTDFFKTIEEEWERIASVFDKIAKQETIPEIVHALLKKGFSQKSTLSIEEYDEHFTDQGSEPRGYLPCTVIGYKEGHYLYRYFDYDYRDAFCLKPTEKAKDKQSSSPIHWTFKQTGKKTSTPSYLEKQIREHINHLQKRTEPKRESEQENQP